MVRAHMSIGGTGLVGLLVGDCLIAFSLTCMVGQVLGALGRVRAQSLDFHEKHEIQANFKVRFLRRNDERTQIKNF